MPETTLDVRHLPKEEAYHAVEDQLRLALGGISDRIAIMATMSCLLYHGFGHLWVGFYRVVEHDRMLRIGPYQGTLGCMEIEFGRGVCGTAARTRRTVVVHDVDQFPGHIACDARSRSEIVVPVFDTAGELIAVLDIDSDRIGTFDDRDASSLERIVSILASPATDVPPVTVAR